MRDRWSRFSWLAVVLLVTGCVSRPVVRLDTGQGRPIIYSPPSSEPPPVEIRQEEFLEALTELALHMRMTVSLPSREGRVVLTTWDPSGGAAKDRLVLPRNAPPPETLARMRLALSFALDSLWEGAAVPISEALDPLAFKVTVYTALSTYLLTLMLPEPVTKGLAAVLTVTLVAYLGLGPVWSMVQAGWRMLHDCEQATTTREVKQAGHRFGQVMGDNGMRVLLLLATAAAGGEAGFIGKGPRLPGFAQASRASPIRTGVSLEAVGQVETVALGTRELVLGLAPAAVASVALGPGGPLPTGTKGSLTGRPTRPGPRDDAETIRGLKRENESARLLADNGYDVEQNPFPLPNRKEPDYKINGEYADCLAPITPSARNIAARIEREKLSQGQADRIVLNLDDSDVTIETMRKQLMDWPISGLKQVIAIKDGKVIELLP